MAKSITNAADLRRVMSRQGCPASSITRGLRSAVRWNLSGSSNCAVNSKSMSSVNRGDSGGASVVAPGARPHRQHGFDCGPRDHPNDGSLFGVETRLEALTDALRLELYPWGSR